MKDVAISELFRKLPSVDELLRSPDLSDLLSPCGHKAVSDAIRRVLDHIRGQLATGNLDPRGLDAVLSVITHSVRQDLKSALHLSLRRVINATGVILHTNLGRAPLSSAALDHAAEVASGYSNLEFDVVTGERGKRDIHVDRLFRELFADEDQPQAAPSQALSTIVVNNNAAAVLIALNTLAEGGEVVVSRGELVEIGGSFRIPDVMAKSGATLREVGTTNRTRISDYERAITENTRLLLRVHRSNFQIVGFTEQPSLAELVALGRKRGIPVMEDLGSGALFDLRAAGIHGEPQVQESLKAGVDVVTFSGDKLLGGPQAGLICGRQALISQIRSNPLFRALRVDKLIYAALEATLLAYVKQDYDAIPTLRMMRIPVGEIERRANAVLAALLRVSREDSSWIFSLVDGRSVLGGGAAPAATLPTILISVRSALLPASEIAAKLRSADPAIVGRIQDDQFVLDLRTVFPREDALLIQTLSSLITG